MNGFSRMKIGKQFNIVYVCAVVVPVLALGIFLVLNIYSMLLTHHRDLVHGSNNSSKKIMKEISDQIYNISDSIAYDGEKLYAYRQFCGKLQSDWQYNDIHDNPTRFEL